MRLSARRRYSSRSPIKAIFSLIFLGLLAAVAIRGFWLYQDSRLGRFDRFNLVLIAKPLTLLSVDLTGKTAMAVTFPDNLYISELAYGYGGYGAAAIYAVGQLDKRGGETVAETVADYLGIPVDGYIYDPVTLPKDVKSFFWGLDSLVGGRSNLNILDRGRLAFFILQIRPDRIKRVALADFAEPLVLADGSMAISAEKEVLDSKLQGDFTESRVRNEAFRLEMINSTSVLGLGNRASRILTNIGANVVNVGTTEGLISGCQIQASSKARSSMTVARVANIFSCQIVSGSDQGRAEIVVLLGQDYARKLGK